MVHYGRGCRPSKYFADKVFLSANYFGDMIRKQTGQTASEYIQNKLIERLKKPYLAQIKQQVKLLTGWDSNIRST